jgi:hypothetical protein
VAKKLARLARIPRAPLASAARLPWLEGSILVSAPSGEGPETLPSKDYTSFFKSFWEIPEY